METKEDITGFLGFLGGDRMEEAIRSRIVQAAAELFQAKGYRSVTLSELAATLGMSKKTLYLYFSGKEQIAEAVLNKTMEAIAGKVALATNREGHPLHIFKETFLAIKQEVMKLSPHFLEEVQKYAPGLYGKMEAFRGRQLTFIEGLFQKARERGLIGDVNPRLLAVLMLENIQRFARPDFAAKHGFSIPEIADALFMLFVENVSMDREP